MRRRYHSSKKGFEILHVWWMKVRMVRLRCMMYEWMLGLWGGCGLLLVGRVPWGLGTNPWLTPSTKLLSPHSWKTFQWASLSAICIPPPFQSFRFKIVTIGERKNFERCDLLSALYGSLSAQLTSIEFSTQMKYFSIIDQISYIFSHFLSERYQLRWYN